MCDTLPEGCIAQVLSMTSPEDACRLSVVGTLFHSAAESDAVWEKFLPLDYKDIITRASSDSSPPLRPKSKKELYLWLSDHPLIIDHGTKSFSLEKRTGKRRYMLAARELTIIWGGTPRYWRWTSLFDSRFVEVAELMNVCWLEIRGKMNVNLLSPNTTYTAYLVFKLTEEAIGFKYKPADVSVGIKEGERKTRTVCLDPNRGRRLGHHPMYQQHMWAPRGFEEEEVMEMDEGFFPKDRGDGWMEIELGDYFNVEEEDGNKELEMSLLRVRGSNWKSGLIVQGIEIRPKVADK